MARKPKQVPTTIDPNRIKTRDPLLQKLIQGATKSGTHVDRRREASRRAARKRVSEEDE